MRRKWLILMALPLGVVLAVFLHGGKVHAAPFARAPKVGYFYSDNKTTGHNIFDYGTLAIPASVNNIDSFVAFYQGKLGDGVTKDYIGASFTILTMLGYPAGTDPSVAVAQFPRWSALVHYYASKGWVNFFVDVSFTENTYYQDPIAGIPNGDVAWYADSGTATSIAFYNPDGTSYVIKRDCANPIGPMSSLQMPMSTLTCGLISTNPADPEVGQPVDISATVTENNPMGPPDPPTAAGMTVQRQGGGAAGQTVDATLAGSTITVKTRPANPFVPPQTGHYTVQWTVSIPNANPITCGGDFQNYSSFEVMTYPFFSSQGGDVVAGSSFATTTGATTVACGAAPHNTNAGISTWNNSGNPDFSGASSEYAAMAMNLIQGFITNQGKGTPTSLSLSNVNQPFGGVNSTSTPQFFGGMFGAVPSCIDYWNTKPNLGTLSPLGAATTIGVGFDGEYARQAGALTINGGQIGNGKHVTMYVDGDVNITAPITYQSSSWGSVDQIPTFKLIVHGSIFINPTVDTLDGTYVAVPDNNYTGALATQNNFAAPQKGTITTCASSPFASYNPHSVPGNGMLANCNHQLTVNGSFIANQLFLIRTFGTRGSNVPAEIFKLSPEMWLAPSLDSSTGAGSVYQSVTGLPPVL